MAQIVWTGDHRHQRFRGSTVKKLRRTLSFLGQHQNHVESVTFAERYTNNCSISRSLFINSDVDVAFEEIFSFDRLARGGLECSFDVVKVESGFPLRLEVQSVDQNNRCTPVNATWGHEVL